MTNMNQNGRSMIEMLGVLAIIGVLSVGGIAGYSKAMLKYKTNKLIDQVTMLTTNIRTLYGQQKTFSGLDGRKVVRNATSGVLGFDGDADGGTSAIAMGVVPDDMIVNGALQNPFAGPYTITIDHSVPDAAGFGRAFIIGIDGIPKEACMAFATSDWGSNYSSGLIGMAINHQYSAAASAASVKLIAGSNSGKEAYAGADCKASTEKGTLGATTNAAICAAHMPLKVAQAATACDCTGSACSVAIKYY